MQLTQDETDPYQTRHQRYQLFYRNVKVEGVEYSLHSRNQQLETAHGRIVENLSIDVTKAIPELQALTAALADLKLSLGTFTGKELPKGTLLIASINGQEAVSQNFRLCYAFDVRPDLLNLTLPGLSLEPQRVYVDAVLGQVIRRDPLIHKCFHVADQSQKSKSGAGRPFEPDNLLKNAHLVPSAFVPRWNRYQQADLTFETEPSGGQFRLSSQNGALITRRDLNSNGRWDSNGEVLNGSTNWGTNAQNATTAHWLTQRVHLFFSRWQNGYNRQGAYPKILVDYSQAGRNPVNAFWNRADQLAFGFAPTSPGNGNPNFSRTLVTADILGHEYTHAVTQFSANLEYRGESGALNESISDIFGTAFEHFLFPNDWNWDLAEDAYQFRDMANPRRAFPPVQPAQPQVYLGDGWQETTNPLDNGGVHINSGVMNKWFHTLCTGQGPNGQSITPIAFDDATEVVYWALRYGYLQSTSNYEDASNATRNAAGARFSSCSPVQRQVAAAWRTAGLPGPDCPDDCNFSIADISVTGSTCNQPLTLSTNCIGTTAAGCANFAYSWSGFGYLGSSIPNTSTITVPAPSSGGSYEFTVGSQKGSCWTVYKSVRVNINCGNNGGCTQQAISVVAPTPNQTLTVSSFPFYFDIRTQVCDPQGISQVQYNINGNWSGHVDIPDNSSSQPYTLTAARWASLASSNNAFTINQPGTYTIQPRLFSNAGGFLDASPIQITVVQGGSGNPNPDGGLAFVNPPSLNCGTGQLTVSTTGGNGQPVEFRAPGLQDWNTNNVFNVPTYQRNGTTFTIQARQSGVEINPLNYLTSCAGYRFAAVGAEETESGLLIAPNPTHGQFTVRFSLPAKQTATLSIVNGLGQSVWQREVVGTGQAQTETVDMNRETAGQYVVRLKAANGVKAGKLLLVR